MEIILIGINSHKNKISCGEFKRRLNMKENIELNTLPWWTSPDRTSLFNEIMKDANDENIMKKYKQIEDIIEQDLEKEEREINNYFKSKKEDFTFKNKMKFIKETQWILGITLALILFCIVMGILTSPQVCAIGC